MQVTINSHVILLTPSNTLCLFIVTYAAYLFIVIYKLVAINNNLCLFIVTYVTYMF